jgi:hypothetical protein
MLDSPFEYCLVCREYVLLDQTQRQCEREHSCTALSKCPLQRFFTGMEFRQDPEARGRGGGPRDRTERNSQCPPQIRNAAFASRRSDGSAKKR